MNNKSKKVMFLIIAGMILTAMTVTAGNVLLIDSAAPGNSKSGDYIGFYVENPKYLVNGKEYRIDKNNQKVAPYLKNGQVYIPARCITEAYGAGIEWNAKTNTATIKAKNGEIFKITANSNVINKTDAKKKASQIKMAAKAELYEGRIYVPASAMAEAFGKNYFYDRGLIIITDSKKLPDNIKTDTLITNFTGIKNVGSKEKLVELLGYDPDDYYGYDICCEDMAADGVAPPPTMATMPTTVATEAADMPAEKPSAPKTDGGAESEAIDFSETNTQVQGVDEADIIKTDGQYIYYVRNGVIEIVKVLADGNFEYMSSYKMPEKNYFTFSEIFIDGNRIIAIGSYYRYDDYSGSYTKAVVINTENKKSPKLERSVEVKGNYVTSRKIGSSVYFAANQYFRWYGGGDIMPIYCDTAVSENMVELGYENLRCFPYINGENITSLVGFNIDRPGEEAFIETFLGCGSTIYMSGNAMYIAAVNYNNNGTETIIHKFAADDGKLVFVKSGKAPGTVLNQFSMDEYQTYFRIATTVYDYKKGKEYNGLYIFDNTMEIVGRIDDIAPGERIYSARFMGKRAFMVTFRQVDPLFAIDLSDPKKPVVMGALKIPGYSNYLHPYDENHLIGFGKDTVVDTYGNAYYTGMKISLFDVTDITNPVEMFVETIGARGTDSPLLNNHKALLFSKDKNLLAFPVTVFESKEKAVDGKMPDYGKFTFSGAYVYDIDLKKGFTLRGKISHMTAQDILKSSEWGGNSDLYIQRLLTIRDNLYAASNGKLTSHDLKTLKPVGEFVFKDR